MLRARTVWIDLENLLELLDVEEDTEKFIFLWIAAVSICRAVGSAYPSLAKS